MSVSLFFRKCTIGCLGSTLSPAKKQQLKFRGNCSSARSDRAGQQRRYRLNRKQLRDADLGRCDGCPWTGLESEAKPQDICAKNQLHLRIHCVMM